MFAFAKLWWIPIYEDFFSLIPILTIIKYSRNFFRYDPAELVPGNGGNFQNGHFDNYIFKKDQE